MAIRQVSQVLNQGAANEALENLHFYFYAFEDVTLQSLSARMRATAYDEDNAVIPSAVYCDVVVAGTTVYSTSVSVTSDIASYKTIGLNNVIVQRGQICDIWLKMTRNYSTVYYNMLTAVFPWGGTGDNAPVSGQSGYYARQIECADMTLNLTYNSVWIFNGGNEGYPHLCDEDASRFKFFEKDEDGYPQNWGVWKIDDQNDGYPWIVGYLPSHVVGGAIYKKVNGTLIPVQIYKKVNGTLIPVQIYKKVNSNLIPII